MLPPHPIWSACVPTNVTTSAIQLPIAPSDQFEDHAGANLAPDNGFFCRFLGTKRHMLLVAFSGVRNHKPGAGLGLR